MRNRAAEFGGTFELDSRPGRGTAVRVAVPFHRPEPASEHRARAIELAVTLLFCAGVIAWTRSPLIVGIAVAATMLLVRHLAAYRRLRARAA